MALVVLGLKIKCKVKELNCFSQHVCINGTLVFKIGLDFIGDAQVLAASGFRCVLFVEPFALFCCLVCFRDGEAERRGI